MKQDVPTKGRQDCRPFAFRRAICIYFLFYFIFSNQIIIDRQVCPGV